MGNSPKVFISHTSDDKLRFVIGFAECLRRNGVDAWLDQWEIQPGDSIVEKIFEQGISQADVFIVILSKNTADKPWVREDGSIVSQEEQQKIIDAQTQERKKIEELNTPKK